MKKLVLIPALVLGSFYTFAQSAQEIVKKHMEAIGSADKIAAIKDVTTHMETEVQGTAITIKMVKKVPYFMVQTVEATGMGQVAKTISDGKRFKVENMMTGNTELEGDQLKSSIMQSGLFPESEYLTSGITMSLDGSATVDGKDCHKVNFKVGDTSWSELYDKESGLKLRTIIDTPQGASELTFRDYVEKEGVKFATKMEQSMGGFNMSLEVTDIEVNTGVEDSVFTIE